MPDNAKPAILLTRPRAQAARFAGQLEAALSGLPRTRRPELVIAPLIEIRHLDKPLALEGVGLILLTSANGADALARLTARRDIPCLCVGTRTAERARDHGFAARSAGATAAELESAVRSAPPEGGILYARGRHVARDLASSLRQAGLKVDEAVVYDQPALPLDDRARTLLASGRKVLAPLFSPRASRLFAEQAAPLAGNVTALCLSARVAAPLAGLPLAGLDVAAAPTARAMADLVLRKIAAS